MVTVIPPTFNDDASTAQAVPDRSERELDCLHRHNSTDFAMLALVVMVAPSRSARASPCSARRDRPADQARHGSGMAHPSDP
jgi:hypothetical protein